MTMQTVISLCKCYVRKIRITDASDGIEGRSQDFKDKFLVFGVSKDGSKQDTFFFQIFKNDKVNQDNLKTSFSVRLCDLCGIESGKVDYEQKPANMKHYMGIIKEFSVLILTDQTDAFSRFCEIVKKHLKLVDQFLLRVAPNQPLPANQVILHINSQTIGVSGSPPPRCFRKWSIKTLTKVDVVPHENRSLCLVLEFGHERLLFETSRAQAICKVLRRYMGLEKLESMKNLDGNFKKSPENISDANVRRDIKYKKQISSPLPVMERTEGPVTSHRKGSLPPLPVASGDSAESIVGVFSSISSAMYDFSVEISPRQSPLSRNNDDYYYGSRSETNVLTSDETGSIHCTGYVELTPEPPPLPPRQQKSSPRRPPPPPPVPIETKEPGKDYLNQSVERTVTTDLTPKHVRGRTQHKNSSVKRHRSQSPDRYYVNVSAEKAYASDDDTAYMTPVPNSSLRSSNSSVKRRSKRQSLKECLEMCRNSSVDLNPSSSMEIKGDMGKHLSGLRISGPETGKQYVIENIRPISDNWNSDVAHTVWQLLEGNEAKPDTLGLPRSLRFKLCIHMLPSTVKEKDWRELGSLIGMTFEDIFILETVAQNNILNHTLPEVVLQHWQFAHNCGRSLQPCNLQNLCSLLDQMNREDLLDIVMKTKSACKTL